MLDAIVLLSSLVAADAPSFNGYLSERLTLTHPSAAALTTTRDVPVVDALSEANLQGRARLLDEKLLVSIDASAYAELAGVYADYDPTVDAVVGVDDHDVASIRPFVVFSEAFLSLEPFEHLVLTAGKRRVVWGPGQMASPTDVLNPPRDPTDPASQREGALLVAVDAPFERFTVTGMFLPAVLAQEAGVPYAVLTWPEVLPQRPTGPAGDELHYAAALRAYALFLDADWNAWAVHSNLYDDGRTDQLRLMATFSKTIFGAHEVHAEVLMKQGSGRLYPNAACGPSNMDLFGCALTGQSALHQKRDDDVRIYPDVLVGWRWMLDDESMFSAEYLYEADGLTAQEFSDLARLLKKVGAAQRAGVELPLTTSQPGGGTPLRFQAQTLRRHHVFLGYQKPKIADDWTVGATLITAVEDLSGLLAANVVWNAQEWLTLSAYGYVPIPSTSRISTWMDDDPLGTLDRESSDTLRGFLPIGAYVDGERYGEYDLLPFSGRLLFEARVWF